MVWLAPKHNYDSAIYNMDTRLEGETSSAEQRDEALIPLFTMIWSVHMSLFRPFFNLDNKAALQAKLYKNIEHETANSIIAATHCPNLSIHDIITSVNWLPMHF